MEELLKTWKEQLNERKSKNEKLRESLEDYVYFSEFCKIEMLESCIKDLENILPKEK